MLESGNVADGILLFYVLEIFASADFSIDFDQCGIDSSLFIVTNLCGNKKKCLLFRILPG